MYDALQTFLLGLVIGLTGALAPGPTLVATINASISGDWKIGPKVTAGHMIAESVIFLLIVLGLAALALPYTTAIAATGGIALIIFGALTIAGSREASLNGPVTGTVGNPYVAGLVTSAANPYFWIWWLTIGSAMVIAGLAGGLSLQQFSWWATGVRISGGSRSCLPAFHGEGRSSPDTSYRRIMGACGVFLILFGAYYLSRSSMP
ncbi:MAG: LysE family translocator [Desulfobacterales bacterium]|nr:LysE family translocator [Desulfobacterales bacterium]